MPFMSMVLVRTEFCNVIVLQYDFDNSLCVSSWLCFLYRPHCMSIPCVIYDEQFDWFVIV